MRPIDADALIEVVEKSMAENPHKEKTQRAMHIHEHKYFLTLLAGTPTIQPERAEGEWSDGYRWQRCSLCKQTGKKSWSYCPKCGVKMKGEQNGH